MLIIVSPAKKLDFDIPAPTTQLTMPHFLKETKQLVGGMKTFSAKELTDLMKISDKLGELNAKRFNDFKTPLSFKNAKQAMYAFQGDTYIGLEADKFKDSDIKYAQDHLRILSGLYGLLAPLDLISPYRLEMGTKFPKKTPLKGVSDLYSFWGDKLTKELNKAMIAGKSEILVNLASKEYFSVVDFSKIEGEVITPIFKEKKGESYKVIGLFAKRARGALSHYIIKNRITKISELKKFKAGGYHFSEKASKASELVFLRDK